MRIIPVLIALVALGCTGNEELPERSSDSIAVSFTHALGGSSPLSGRPTEADSVSVAIPPAPEQSDEVRRELLEQALLAATGEAVVDSSAELPRIQVDEEPRLVLPASYAAALASHDPEFKPWNTTPYPAWIRADEGFLANSRQAPFAVIGDLNGDGRTDAVIHGRGAEYSAILVLMTKGAEVSVIEYHREGLSSHPATYSGGFGEIMRHTPPGTYKSDAEDLPLHLATDAFEWLLLEKAASIVYWRNGRFNYWMSEN